jgi:hypothetical protein
LKPLEKVRLVWLGDSSLAEEVNRGVCSDAIGIHGGRGYNRRLDYRLLFFVLGVLELQGFVPSGSRQLAGAGPNVYPAIFRQRTCSNRR